MRKVLAVLVMVAIGGCSSGPRTISAPAPATALDCAMQEGIKAGYTPTSGGISSGFVIMRDKVGVSVGDVAKETTTRLLTLGLRGSNRITADQLTMSLAGGQLRIQAAGINKGDVTSSPSDETNEKAGAILKACSTP